MEMSLPQLAVRGETGLHSFPFQMFLGSAPSAPSLQMLDNSDAFLTPQTFWVTYQMLSSVT